MIYGEEELWDLLSQAEAMPYGAAQIALVEQVIARADAGGFTELAFTARMQGTTAYYFGGEPAKSFVTFSRCLADFDANPGRHDKSDATDLLWQFKWMAHGLTRFPEVPLDRTYAVLDDMQRRYLAGGHSLHAVYSARHTVAEHIGDEAATDKWYAQWCAAPRDELSDCAGCDPSGRAFHLASRGLDEEAVALAEPVLGGRLTCSEQPQGILTVLLLPYLRTGRLDAARDAHRRAYRLVRGNIADLADIADHIHFCAVTGNDGRGLEIIERHLGWLDRAPSPYAAMEFAASAALVLRRLTDAGHGDQPVPRPAHGDRPAGEATVADLGDELATLATTIAARFDLRNGSAHQGRRIAARLADEQLAQLPLSASARTTTGSPMAATAVPATQVPVIPDEASVTELFELAEAHARAAEEASTAAVLTALVARLDESQLTDYDAGRLADLRGQVFANGQDLAAAEDAWTTAMECFTAAGDELRRQVTRSRLGLLRCVTGRVDEGLPEVEQAGEYLAVHAEPDRRAGAQARLAMALLAAEQLEAALAATERAAVDAAETDLPRLVADIALRRAHCLGLLERDEFLVAAGAARELATALDRREYAGASLLYGLALARAERLDDALDALNDAVAGADSASLRADARLHRARVLCGLDRPEAAIDDFVEAVALAAERGDAATGAQARFELAQAYAQADRLIEAAEVAEEAVLGFDALGAQDSADRTRYLLTKIYQQLDEPESALALFDTLVVNLDGYDNLRVRGEMHEEAATLLYRLDRDAEAAGRFAAAAAAYHQVGALMEELRARRMRMLSLFFASEEPAALAALAEVDALVESLPQAALTEPSMIWECAMLAYDGAKILASTGQLPEAASRVATSPAQFRSIEAFREAFIAEMMLGELLIHADRPGDAEPVLRAVVGGLPEDDPARGHAGLLLADALEVLGRDDEAAALRERYRDDTESE